MASRFAQIFWGFIFVLIDVTINGFDIVPDVIGYILIAVGAAGLVGASKKFKTASLASWILLGLSVLVMVVSAEFRVALGVISFLVDCVMVWTLLGGIMELADARDRPDIASKASNRRIAYAAFSLVATLLSFAASGANAAPIAVVLVVVMLILMVMILMLVHQAKHELSNDVTPA